MPAEDLSLTTLVTRAFALVALGAALGLGFNAVRSDGVALDFAAPVVCGLDDGPATLREIEVLGANAAATLCSEVPALIIDARKASAFAQGHIAGALHLPCSASDDAARVAESGLGEGRLLLVYANSTEEAMLVARELQKRLASPDQRIAVLDGGFAAWRDANLACASGGCPQCGEEHAH